MTPIEAAILGVVEGVTEFLPISSTGHLILASSLLGLESDDPALKRGLAAFEVVIQSGALLAVIGHYRVAVGSMIQGLLGRDRAGLNLFLRLILAFLPAVFVGLALGDTVKEHLFGIWPVTVALAVGGVLMVGIETYRARRLRELNLPIDAGRDLGRMTALAAVVIGLGQCLAMWPGTSRSMVTIVTALLLGYSPRAAEFNFCRHSHCGAATAHIRHEGAIWCQRCTDLESGSPLPVFGLVRQFFLPT
jgi:undecaprenyl-diphosphatase